MGVCVRGGGAGQVKWPKAKDDALERALEAIGARLLLGFLQRSVARHVDSFTVPHILPVAAVLPRRAGPHQRRAGGG
jgi:hypothetical protein